MSVESNVKFVNVKVGNSYISIHFRLRSHHHMSSYRHRFQRLGIIISSHTYSSIHASFDLRRFNLHQPSLLARPLMVRPSASRAKSCIPSSTAFTTTRTFMMRLTTSWTNTRITSTTSAAISSSRQVLFTL